jgi:hypothetical protein
MDLPDLYRPTIPAELLGKTDQLRLTFCDGPSDDSRGDPPSTISSVHALDLTDRRGRYYVLTVHQDRLRRVVLSYHLHLRADP